MADTNKLELIVEVDVNKANASIKSVNTGLSSIEQAASKAARGASAGIDGITVSMVKGATAGNLLADAIKKAIEWAKEWTVEAAKYAADTARMEAVTTGLAKAHGDGAEAAKKAVDAVKAVNFSTQDAMKAVQAMVIAEMDLGRAAGLAKLAKDAAAASTEGLTASEAFEKIMMAVESGQGRGLRSMRIYVDLQKEVKYWEDIRGRSLTDREKEEVRLNAIMRESAGLQGAYAEQQDTVAGQMGKLNRAVKDLKDAIGQNFQDDFRNIISLLKDMAEWLQKNIDLLKGVAEVSLAAGFGLAGWKGLGLLAGKTGVAAGTLGLGALGVVGVGGAIGAVGYEFSRLGKDRERRFADIQKQNIRATLGTKGGMAKLRALGLTDADIREALTGQRELESGTVLWSGPKLEPPVEKPDYDAAARIAEARKHNAEAMRAAEELYIRALEERKNAEAQVARQQLEDSMKIIEATSNEAEAAREAINVFVFAQQELAAGIAKIRAEEAREIKAKSSYVDEHGNLQRFTLNPTVLEKIHQATAERIAPFELRFNEEQTRRVEQMWKALAARNRAAVEQYMIEPMRQDLEVWDQISNLKDKFEDQKLVIQKQGVEQRKDLALAQLEGVDAYTLRDKIALEQAKTTIEVDAIKQRTAIELQEIDRRTEYDIREARRAAYAKGIFDEERIGQITDRIKQLGDQEKAALSEASANSIEVQQLKGAAVTRRLVVDQYRSIFDSLKQQAGGVFDALVTKSQSVWQAIGNALKSAVLMAIKEIVTSRVAMVLMNLFVPGARVSMAPGGIGGAGGGLGALLGVGAVPMFGAGGGPIPGGAAGGWGTPPFIPNGGGQVAGQAAYAPAMGAGRFTGMASGAAVMGGSLLAMGGLQRGGTSGNLMTIGGGASMGYGMAPQLGMTGYGGAIFGAGAGVAAAGLQRGGWSGVGMSTGGGALIGLQIGGPLGAAIGAIAGFIAGLIRLGIKGAQEKAKQKIKDLYGVDISDKGILKQIVDIAKSAFGGNLDMAIRAPQIRDLIQLYAMTTGQKPKGMPGNMAPLDLVQSGGSLYQAQSFQNGTALPGLGGLPTFDKIGAGVPSSATGVVIQLDGPATTALLRGEAVQAIVQNPRAVQSATVSATRANAGRRQLTSLQLSPGLLTA